MKFHQGHFLKFVAVYAELVYIKYLLSTTQFVSPMSKKHNESTECIVPQK